MLPVMCFIQRTGKPVLARVHLLDSFLTFQGTIFVRMRNGQTCFVSVHLHFFNSWRSGSLHSKQFTNKLVRVTVVLVTRAYPRASIYSFFRIHHIDIHTASNI